MHPCDGVTEGRDGTGDSLQYSALSMYAIVARRKYNKEEAKTPVST